jgi:hypothetical protein
MPMRAARTEKDLPHKNTLVLRKLKIYFQRFPAKEGTDADRAINDVEYVVKVGGRVVDKGKTAADGSVEVQIPAGFPAQLEIFGTTYDLVIHNWLEAETDVKGQQRRLSMLGYELGDADGTFGEKTDRAALNFQVDKGLEPDGNVGSGTRSQLKTELGE